MRLFWAILSLLAAAALVLALLPETKPRQRDGEAPRPGPSATTAPAPTPMVSSAPADPAAELLDDLRTDRVGELEAKVAATVAAPETPLPPPVPADATGAAIELALPTIPEAEVVPGTVHRQADGALLLDGRWVVRGEGTAEKPYRVSWDLLASASESFRPRVGERKLPGRIAFLEGRHVRIEGYLAFPLIATEAKEALVMLNQWDGCCIGVPPTPYDAVEVRLDKPFAVGKRHALVYGTVEGILRIEPYIVEQWLVGLYLLDGGSLRVEM